MTLHTALTIAFILSGIMGGVATWALAAVLHQLAKQRRNRSLTWENDGFETGIIAAYWSIATTNAVLIWAALRLTSAGWPL